MNNNRERLIEEFNDMETELLNKIWMAETNSDEWVDLKLCLEDVVYELSLLDPNYEK